MNSVNYYDPNTQELKVVADKSVPMVGASASTSGSAGYVPAPAAGDNDKFLRGDGTWVEIQGGGGGIALADVSGAAATSFATTVSLTWSDPSDIVLEGIPLAVWSGTKVVRKVGSAPTSRTDGTTIIDNKTRNAYSSTALEDTGLSYGTTYYYKFYPYTTDGKYTEGSSVSVTPARQIISTTPSITTYPTYDGTEKTVTINNFDSSKMTVSGNTGTNSGSYTAIVTPKEGYCWSDGTYGSIELSWLILVGNIDVPTVSSSLTYNGSEQSPTIGSYDTTKITLVSGDTGTNAGTYTILFRLVNATDYAWTDGTTADKEVEWTIARVRLTPPTVSSSLVYNGLQQTATVSSYDNTKITVTGLTGTNAGTYTATESLIDDDNYEWTDGTIADKTQTWSIARAKLSAPTVSSNLVYNGSSRTATVSSYDNTKISVSGITAINAGTYVATISLIDNENYWWTDETTANKTQNWTIAKATGSASISASSVELDADHKTVDVTISYATGDIGTITSSDSTVATGSKKNSSTVTISSVDETTGTATITINIDASTNYNATTKTVSVSATFTIPIFGVEWDGTSTSALTRTDDAANFTNPVPAVNNGSGSSPFDKHLPWKGMKRVTTNTNVGVLVEIPKYYYKWTKDGAKLKLQISMEQKEGFFVSPAHASREDGYGERDVVYVGAYSCSGASNSIYKSISGVNPKVSMSITDFRSNIHTLGSTVWQWDYAMYWTIMMLYLVEYANWDSQTTIGYGCSDSGSIQNTGITDAMAYHTGTSAVNRTTYGHTRYRYIEDLWGNVFNWCDGIYSNSSSELFCTLNPASFANTSARKKIGVKTLDSDYIKSWSLPSATRFEYAIFPETISTVLGYVCDKWAGSSTSAEVFQVGGTASQSQVWGAFCLYNARLANFADNTCGSRVMVLPNDNEYVAPFSTGTEAELSAALTKHYNNEIDLHKYWNVGEERVVNLAAMSATSVGESHVSQNQIFVIMDKGGKELVTAINGHTECAFIVGQETVLSNGSNAENGYMNSSDTTAGGWDSCARRTWCNNVYKNALPSGFRTLFKQHKNITGDGPSSATITSNDYFALPSEKEVMGAVLNGNATAEQNNKQFKYYTLANNRKKRAYSGTDYNKVYWVRTPRGNMSSAFVAISENGVIGGLSSSNYSIAPFGCI